MDELGGRNQDQRKRLNERHFVAATQKVEEGRLIITVICDHLSRHTYFKKYRVSLAFSDRTNNNKLPTHRNKRLQTEAISDRIFSK